MRYMFVVFPIHILMHMLHMCTIYIYSAVFIHTYIVDVITIKTHNNVCFWREREANRLGREIKEHSTIYVRFSLFQK